MTRNAVGVYLSYNLAESLFRVGRWGEAERWLTDAVESGVAGPFTGTLLELRGRIAALSGRYDDAAEDLDKAGRCAPMTRTSSRST